MEQKNIFRNKCHICLTGFIFLESTWITSDVVFSFNFFPDNFVATVVIFFYVTIVIQILAKLLSILNNIKII